MKKLIKTILGHRIVKLLGKVQSAFFSYLSEEPKEVVNRRQRFYNQFINSNDLVFDVGANVGNRTKPFLKIGARVVAIEPQKKCCKILEKKFHNNIELVQMGLGKTEEIKDFFVANNHTLSSFSAEWIESVKKTRFMDYSWAEPIKIQITTLDKLIDKYGLPKFIKIDVEGFELEVLKGLTYAIDIISFEYAVPEQTQKAKDCIDQIEKYNSKIECNFSICESMEFELKHWQSTIDFKSYMDTKEFNSTIFGDIYVRKIC